MCSVHVPRLMVAALAICFAGPATAEDVSDQEAALAESVSLSVERDSLERCIQALAKAVRAKREVTIKIVGKDLQLEGITRNQAIRDLAAVDRPAAEILTDLVIRANPDRDVTDSRDPKLKLIWVAGVDPDDADKPVILITTRAAAAKRGDKLPLVFQPLRK